MDINLSGGPRTLPLFLEKWGLTVNRWWVYSLTSSLLFPLTSPPLSRLSSSHCSFRESVYLPCIIVPVHCCLPCRICLFSLSHEMRNIMEGGQVKSPVCSPIQESNKIIIVSQDLQRLEPPWNNYVSSKVGAFTCLFYLPSWLVLKENGSWKLWCFIINVIRLWFQLQLLFQMWSFY